MSSTLTLMVRQMRNDLHSSRYQARFVLAQERRQALRAYASPGAVLDALADDSHGTYPEREALTKALMSEHREAPASLWSALLLVGYFPMLIRLRGRLLCESVIRDELDQIVVAEFLDVVKYLPPDVDRMPYMLRVRTQRRVFRALRRDRELDAVEECIEDLGVAAEELGLTPRASEEEDTGLLAELLVRTAEKELSALGADVVLAALLDRDKLREYSEQLAGPSDDRSKERVYQRLKRQRARALRRIRRMFTEPVEPASSSDVGSVDSADAVLANERRPRC